MDRKLDSKCWNNFNQVDLTMDFVASNLTWQQYRPTIRRALLLKALQRPFFCLPKCYRVTQPSLPKTINCSTGEIGCIRVSRTARRSNLVKRVPSKHVSTVLTNLKLLQNAVFPLLWNILTRSQSALGKKTRFVFISQLLPARDSLIGAPNCLRHIKLWWTWKIILFLIQFCRAFTDDLLRRSCGPNALLQNRIIRIYNLA